MNVSEANAVHQLLDALPKAIPYVDRNRRDAVVASAVMLADRAYKTLTAGPTGQQVRAQLEAQMRTF